MPHCPSQYCEGNDIDIYCAPDVPLHCCRRDMPSLLVFFGKEIQLSFRSIDLFEVKIKSAWLSHWMLFQIIMYSGELIWHVYMCVRLAQKIHGCQVRKFNHSLLLLLIVTQLQYLSDWWYRKRNTTVHMVCWEWSMRSGFLTIVDLDWK